MFKRFAGSVAVCLFLFIGMSAYTSVINAQQLESNSYKFVESTIGGGGLVQSNSNSFQTYGANIGDAAVGNSASGNFQLETGSVTTNDPTLSFAINNPSPNFGAFSATAAATATSTFSVSNYTSYGYVVQMIGDPPTNGPHVIDGMTTTGLSSTGVEQFGINLVANTSPASVGANPAHDLFGVGDAAPNYATSNSYRFVPGETIAIGPKSSGKTTYTISYIVNVESLTPGGIYTGRQTLICTATF